MDKEHRFILSALALGAILCLQGCSVKEDRDVCPTYVSVKADADAPCLVSFYAPDGDLLERRTLSAGELSSGENWTKIRKGDIRVSVLSHWDGMTPDGGRDVVCASGTDAAPIWAFTRDATASGDDLLVEGVLQKQHAVITLVFKNDDGNSYPYDIRVIAGCKGIDLFNQTGVSGEMTLEPVPDEELTASFRLARQDSGALRLLLLSKTDGSTVAELDLGRYIALTGYNWDAEWLADVTVTIDFARAQLTIAVEDWDEVVTFRLTI